jgi:hypothetical protein
MLVVVRLVGRVTMLSMQVVDMIIMGDRGMTAVEGVDMHVGAVGQVGLVRWLLAVGELIDMVGAGRVYMPVMEVVDVVVMRDRGMAAPLVMNVLVVLDRRVVRDRCGRLPGSILHGRNGSRGWAVWYLLRRSASGVPLKPDRGTSTGVVLQSSTIGGGAWPRG